MTLQILGLINFGTTRLRAVPEGFWPLVCIGFIGIRIRRNLEYRKCSFWFPCHLRITVRTIIVMMILTCRGCYFVLEQPGSSQVVHFPELKLLKKLMKSCGLTTYFTRLPRTQMGVSILDKISALWFCDRAIRNFMLPQPSNHLPSWMGSWGAKSPKLSMAISSALWPQLRWINTISFVIKIYSSSVADPTLLDQWGFPCGPEKN